MRSAARLEGFPEYVAHEMRAVEIRLFDLGIVPGLLQTPDYAAAITAGAVRRGAITEQQAEERLALLADRQASIARTPPPMMFVILDESCLLRPLGGPDVMARQLDRLIEFAALPSAVLQVAPFTLAEVATNLVPAHGTVNVRDAKDPAGPALSFPAESFAAFVTGIQNGEFGTV